MTNATRPVAVVATRLPITDRRALSQAWYSALHVAQPEGSARAPISPDVPPTAGHQARGARADAAATPGARAERVGVAAARRTSPPVPAGIERRVPPTVLARRMRLALARSLTATLPPGAGVRSSCGLAIKLDTGRVQLLVRSDGAATRVVAICAPHVRERVERALAAARFGLAASGLPIEANAATAAGGRR